MALDKHFISCFLRQGFSWSTTEDKTMVYKITALTWKSLKDIFSPELAFENYKKKKNEQYLYLVFSTPL